MAPIHTSLVVVATIASGFVNCDVAVVGKYGGLVPKINSHQVIKLGLKKNILKQRNEVQE